jgi:hypothetical protein
LRECGSPGVAIGDLPVDEWVTANINDPENRTVLDGGGPDNNKPGRGASEAPAVKIARSTRAAPIAWTSRNRLLVRPYREGRTVARSPAP